MNKKKHLSLNESVFDQITEESAYWIGFLMADGCIYKGIQEQPQIIINLALKDIPHLYKFKKFLGSGHKVATYSFIVKNDEHFYCRFQFNSDKIVKELSKYGVIPRKSLVAKALNGIENNKHFWRGMIDGDGSMFIYIYKCNPKIRRYPRITFYGSSDIVDQFIVFIKTISSINSHKLLFSKNLFGICISSTKPAIKIIRELYDEATVYLDRKHEKAKNLIREFG